MGLKIKNKNVSTLSGGEKQRLQIVRSLINNPKIILADEPTSALDEVNKKEIFKLLEKLSKTRLVIVVTHENVENYLNDYTLLKLEDYKLIELQKNSLEMDVLENNKENKITSKRKGILVYNLKKIQAKPFRTTLSVLISSICLSLFGCMINVLENTKKEILNSFFESEMGFIFYAIALL